MAGGKGTRIASVASDIPKPMIPVLGKPILEYQLQVLKKNGYEDILISIGHLGSVIRDYFKDGSNFGVRISYIEETQPLGTAGALYLMKEQLSAEQDFLLLNGDIIFDVDFGRFYQAHQNMGGLVTLFTHPNSHPYDSGVIEVDENHKVIRWLHKEDERLWYQNRVNAGLHFISTKLLEQFAQLEKKDLDRDILKPLIADGKLYAYDSPEYVKDMGTPDRLEAVASDIRNGIVEGKNLLREQMAVFLDRDGTINKDVGFLNDIEQMELLPKAAEAVRKINESGYMAILVTNQPVIARGEVSFAELNQIHNKLETLLGEKGAYLDAIYFCPHHPDKGFEGEVKELKIICDCRKPKPGMFYQAAADYHINLAESYMIGDAGRDMQAGQTAGCHTIYIGDSTGLVPQEADRVCSDLYTAVCTIFES